MRRFSGITAIVIASVLVTTPVAVAVAVHQHGVHSPAAAAAPPHPAQAPVNPPTATSARQADYSPPAVAPPVVSASALAEQVRTAVQNAEPGSQVGVDVVDNTTGQAIASLNANQQFYTASVVKLLIALDAFHTANWQPDANTTQQVTQMLSYSDDDIADDLWDYNGGNNIVARMINLIGLHQTTQSSDDTEWGETLMSPADAVTVYHYLTTQVPEPARDIIVNALKNAAQTATDGTNQYFGIPDGLPGDTWAIKQGWMSLDSSTTMNTTGLVGSNMQYTVVVMSSQPAGIDWSTGGNALTAGVGVLRQDIDN
jgi:hypothetical protein